MRDGATFPSGVDILLGNDQQGEVFVVIGWPASWLFKAYPNFAKDLEQTAGCLLRNDCVGICRLDRCPAMPVSVSDSQIISG
jgi:hypothetical protein